MVIAEFFSSFKSLEVVNYLGAEDFSDRVNFFYTSTLLMVCCSIVTVRTYFLHPLACFIPNTFGEADAGQEQFVNNYCWTEGTYAVHPREFTIDNDLPDGGLSKYESKKIIYYQWVPFVLGIQCMCFYLPRVLWQVVSYQRSGTDIGQILRTVADAATADEEKHKKLINHVSRRLEQILFRYRCIECSTLKDKVRRVCWKYVSYIMPSQFTGSWLILLYFLVKMAYLLNSLGQLVVMHKFLKFNSTRYTFYGLELLVDLLDGIDWQNSMVFPRVGCCAVFMKTASYGNWQFSQCTLPINMINEKIYILLWFWVTFVSVSNIISIVVWIVRVYSVSCSTDFVKKYLRLADNYQDIKKHKSVKRFVKDFLRHDGTFLLKMIALNAGDAICAEILQCLWKLFLQKKSLYVSKEGEQEPEQQGLFSIRTDVVAIKGRKKRNSMPMNFYHSNNRKNPSAPPLASLETLKETEVHIVQVDAEKNDDEKKPYKHSNSYS